MNPTDHNRDSNPSLLRISGKLLGKTFFIALALFLALTLLVLLGVKTFNHPGSWKEIGDFVDGWFWGFLICRWLLYGVMYWQLPRIINHYLSDSVSDEIETISGQYRWVFVRVAIVYELLFPLDIIAWLSGGQ